MSNRKNGGQAEKVDDACPFPPGVDLPRKNSSTIITASIFSDPKFVASALIVVGLIFILGFTLVPPPVIQIPSTPSIWNSATPAYEETHSPDRPEKWTPRYGNVTTLKQDIILNGDQTYRIENGSYHLLGSILVQGNAKLIIRNADISITYKSGYSWLDPIQTIHNMMLRENATLEAYNSTIYYPENEASIGFYNSSRAKIIDCDLQLVDFYGLKNSTLELSGSRANYIALTESSTLSMNSSSVYGVWPITYDYGGSMETRQVKIGKPSLNAQNSEIHTMSTYYRNSTITINGSINGYHDSWSSSDIAEGGDGFKIHLARCNFTVSQVWGEGCEVNITNVHDLYDVLVRWCRLKVTHCTLVYLSAGGTGSIDGCLVYVLNIFEGEFDVSNCRVHDLYLNSLHGEVSLDGVKATRLSGHDFNCTVNGELVVENKTSPWLQGHSQVTRNYPIQVLNGDRAAQSIELSVTNSTGDVIWKGTTDKLGAATISITYYQNLRINDMPETPGLRDTLKLVASNGSQSREVEISLLSDTPVVISFPSIETPIWTQGWFLQGLSIIIAVLVVALFLLRRRPELKRPKNYEHYE